jgi:hypothetical protein
VLRVYCSDICAVPRRLFSAFSDYYFTEIRFIGEVMCGASAVAVLKCIRFWSFGCEFTFIQSKGDYFSYLRMVYGKLDWWQGLMLAGIDSLLFNIL